MARMGFIQDEMDLKLLVLYIMARIAAPITFLQLLELALCDAGVDYFSLTQAVEHLVETEHLSREGERYAITEKGRRNSEICESSLPYSVRRRCDDNLVRVNETLMREQQVQGEVLPNPDGTCTCLLYTSLQVRGHRHAGALDLRVGLPGDGDKAVVGHQRLRLAVGQRQAAGEGSFMRALICTRRIWYFVYKFHSSSPSINAPSAT